MDEDCQTPLHLAAAGGHLAVVQALAPPRLNCVEILQEDKYQMTPWHLAIESG
jgi:ankyrin repeat protein